MNVCVCVCVCVCDDITKHVTTVTYTSYVNVYVKIIIDMLWSVTLTGLLEYYYALHYEYCASQHY